MVVFLSACVRGHGFAHGVPGNGQYTGTQQLGLVRAVLESLRITVWRTHSPADGNSCQHSIPWLLVSGNGATLGTQGSTG